MHERTTAYHRLAVIDEGMIRILKFERVRQSSMYLDAPFDTDFEYPGYLHLAIAVKPQARRTLVIGLGGGSVVKRMWRDYPEMHLDVIEIDPEVVDVAREYFALPDDERIRVFVDDGRRFLESSSDVYDIIIVDAFDDDHVPRPLLTEEFLREARDHLEPDGVIAYNVCGSIQGDRSRSFRSFHRTACNVWRRVWTFPIGISDGSPLGNNRNIIVVATDEPLSSDDLLGRIADRVGGMVTVPSFHLCGEDLYTGSIRTGDVPMLLDPRPKSPKRRAR